MKLFSKSNKEDKKKNASDAKDSEEINADKLKDNDSEKPSKDSDSKKRSFFSKSLFDDKKKQNESSKMGDAIAVEKPTNKVNVSQQKDDWSKTWEKDSMSSQNNPTDQQLEFQKDETITDDMIGKLIQAISETNEKVINPFINLEKNSVSYPLLAQIGQTENNLVLLDKLASLDIDILEKGIYDRLAVCPEHPQYFAVSIRLYCPYCSSTDLTKLHLFEHKICGYIAEKNDYGVTADAEITKCPSCKNPVRNQQKEMRVLGLWYQCNSCTKKFDNAVVKLHCRKFDHDFDIHQASVVVIPYYKLKPESKTIHNYAFSLIPQIKKQIASYGFVVEESSSVKGKSGVSHKTGIYAYNNENKTIIIDIKSADAEIVDTEMDYMLGKVFDISPTFAIFIGIPSLSDRAKAMAAAHNIFTVTGRNFADVLAEVDKFLKTRLTVSQIGKID